MSIRPERSFDRYSRGAELVRAIHRMWRVNAKISSPRTANIEALMADFDLTLTEWFYWSKQARSLANF